MADPDDAEEDVEPPHEQVEVAEEVRQSHEASRR
jgi:hypothetical protein